MFTGIITDQGTILNAEQQNQGRVFRIGTSYNPASIDIGASIACNGVCLTVTKLSNQKEAAWFEVEAWAEALQLTNVANWQSGSIVNLERSMKMGDEFGGHMVSGHVDGLAEIIKKNPIGEATRFTLQAPDSLAKYIVPKGSVALDGTSLTVNEVNGTQFDVLLIRHTLGVTTWGTIQQGDRINIEVDQMARHIVRTIEQHQSLLEIQTTN